MESKEKMKAVLEMHESLVESVYLAGGSTGWCTGKNLDKMTALDLILKLATNDIRFYCTRYPEVQDKKGGS